VTLVDDTAHRRSATYEQCLSRHKARLWRNEKHHRPSHILGSPSSNAQVRAIPSIAAFVA
jgi:hypothetical protein